jgi:uncharacterized protein (TIGR02996 family)
MARHATPKSLVIPGLNVEFILSKKLRGWRYGYIRSPGVSVTRDVIERIARLGFTYPGTESLVAAARAQANEAREREVVRVIERQSGPGGRDLPPGLPWVSDATIQQIRDRVLRSDVEEAGRLLTQGFEGFPESPTIRAAIEANLGPGGGIQLNSDVRGTGDGAWGTFAASPLETAQDAATQQIAEAVAGGNRAALSFQHTWGKNPSDPVGMTPLNSAWEEAELAGPAEGRIAPHFQTLFSNLRQDGPRVVFVSQQVMQNMDQEVKNSRQKYRARPIDEREERPFWRGVAARPEDDLPRLIFADWLDSRGDPHGPYIRDTVEAFRDTAACPAGRECRQWRVMTAAGTPKQSDERYEKLCPGCQRKWRMHEAITRHGETFCQPVAWAVGTPFLGGMTWLKRPHQTEAADSMDARSFERINVAWARGFPYAIQVRPALLPWLLNTAKWDLLPLTVVALDDWPRADQLRGLRWPDQVKLVVIYPGVTVYSPVVTTDPEVEGLLPPFVVSGDTAMGSPDLIVEHRFRDVISDRTVRRQLGFDGDAAPTWEKVIGPKDGVVTCTCQGAPDLSVDERVRRLGEPVTALCANFSYVSLGSVFVFRWGQCRRCLRLYRTRLCARQKLRDSPDEGLRAVRITWGHSPSLHYGGRIEVPGYGD